MDMKRKPFQKNHVGEVERILIGMGVYGYITEKAKEYIVSRWFIYYCYFQLMFLMDLSRLEGERGREESGYYRAKEEEAVLSLYLECEASVSGIKGAIKNILGEEISGGKISEIINGYGGMLPESEEGIRVAISFVSDEIFKSRKPVLVTVDGESGYILSMKEEERRDKDSWGKCWIELIDEGTGEVRKIVADNGKGIVSGIEMLFSEEVYQEDLFHVITRLACLLWILERKAYGAIAKEYEAERLFDRARTEKTLEKRLQGYEEAYAEALKWILIYDDFVYLFRQLQEVLQIVDKNSGQLRVKSEVESEIEAILDLMEEIDYEKVKEGVDYFRKHQQNLLRYFDEVEKADKLFKEVIPDEFIRDIMVLLYSYRSQTYTASGKRLRKLKKKIASLEEILLEWLTQKEVDSLYGLVEGTLSKIIRSSSIVENTNSRLRRFFDSARGQINQNRLNLIRFYLNHKVFTRGKRKGSSPAQLFHNQKDNQLHWLDALKSMKTRKLAA